MDEKLVSTQLLVEVVKVLLLQILELKEFLAALQTILLCRQVLSMEEFQTAREAVHESAAFQTLREAISKTPDSLSVEDILKKFEGTIQ